MKHDSDQQQKQGYRTLLVFVLALIYGLVTRLLFASEVLGNVFRIVAWSFIFLVPLGFGALTTFLGLRLCGYSVFWVVVAPMLVALIGMVPPLSTGMPGGGANGS